MKKYPSNQVVTVRELQLKEILHVGKVAGICLELSVAKIADDKSYMVARVGNSSTYVKLTGIDLRDPQFPVFRKADCPFCAINKLEEAQYQAEPSLTNAGQLLASDVKSSLANVEGKPRRGDALGSGGAIFRSYTDRHRDMLRRGNQALKKQIEQ